MKSLLLHFLFAIISCSTSNDDYLKSAKLLPEFFQTINFEDFEDETIKFSKAPMKPEWDGKYYEIFLKKFNKKISINKRVEEKVYKFVGGGPECLGFVYLPQEGVICVNSIDSKGIEYGHIMFRLNAFASNIGEKVMVVRQTDDREKFSPKSFILIQAFENKKKSLDTATPIFSGKITHFVSNKPIKAWDQLLNIVEYGFELSQQWKPENLKPVLIRISDAGHVQFLSRNLSSNKSQVELTTLNPDFSLKNSTSDFKLVMQSPENPIVKSSKNALDAHFASINYRVVGHDNDFNIFYRNQSVPLQNYSYAFLREHSNNRDFFTFIGADGETWLPKGVEGIVPIIVPEIYSINTNESVIIPRTHGWIAAYPNGKEFVWGWVSSELTHETGPIWKDFYLSNLEGEEFTTYKAHNINFHHFEVSVEFVNPLVLVAQNFNGQWSAFTQGFYFGTSQEDIPATRNLPNNFKGKVLSASTDTEAVDNLKRWLIQYKQNIAQEEKEVLKVVLTIQEAGRKNFEKEKEQRAVAKAQAEVDEHYRKQAQIKREQWEKDSARRSYNTGQLMNAAASRGQNLSNISSKGASDRAIRSLKSMTNRILQQTGKSW